MAAVAHHDGAPGVDGQACSAYTQSDEVWVCWRDSLLEELRAKTYRPRPVRRVWIPKGHGKTRPLGLAPALPRLRGWRPCATRIPLAAPSGSSPTVKDRVVQTAGALLLRRSGKPTAIPTATPAGPNATPTRRWTPSARPCAADATEVIDADLSGCFDSIPPFAISDLKFEISEGPSRQ